MKAVLLLQDAKAANSPSDDSSFKTLRNFKNGVSLSFHSLQRSTKSISSPVSLCLIVCNCIKSDLNVSFHTGVKIRKI